MTDMNRPGVAGKNLDDLQKVGEAARDAGVQAKQAGADAVEKAKEVARDAKQRGASLVDAVSEKASLAAEAQKDSLAGQLESVARAVHSTGEQLEGQQDWIAHLVERGAAELRGLANTLRTNDLQSLLGELEGLARRQPALFVGASMAAGFALARVGKVAVSGAAQAGTDSGLGSSADAVPGADTGHVSAGNRYSVGATGVNRERQ